MIQTENFSFTDKEKEKLKSQVIDGMQRIKMIKNSFFDALHSDGVIEYECDSNVIDIVDKHFPYRQKNDTVSMLYTTDLESHIDDSAFGHIILGFYDGELYNENVQYGFFEGGCNNQQYVVLKPFDLLFHDGHKPHGFDVAYCDGEYEGDAANNVIKHHEWFGYYEYIKETIPKNKIKNPPFVSISWRM